MLWLRRATLCGDGRHARAFGSYPARDMAVLPGGMAGFEKMQSKIVTLENMIQAWRSGAGFALVIRMAVSTCA